jgi:hypothetical protein
MQQTGAGPSARWVFVFLPDPGMLSLAIECRAVGAIAAASARAKGGHPTPGLNHPRLAYNPHWK